MPTNYTTSTTEELKGILLDPAKASEHEAALVELLCEERVIEEDNTAEDLRGGIRPTRRP